MTRRAPAIAFGALLALWLVGCELIVGGPEQAVVESNDASEEDRAEGSAVDVAGKDAGRVSHDAGVDLFVAPPPCMPAASCAQAEQMCLGACTMMQMTCTSPPGKGHGNGNGNCQDELEACNAQCVSACQSCAGCAGADAAGCAGP